MDSKEILKKKKKLYNRQRYKISKYNDLKDINYQQGNRSHYWADLLGEELREKLITQAHEDAKIFHKLLDDEKREYNKNRKSYFKRTVRVIKEPKNASRNILVRSASAAT